MQEVISRRNEAVERCVNECLGCYKVCADTTAECLRMGSNYAEANHIELLDACGKACLTSADYMLKNSEFYPKMCRLCAEVCDECAESCDKFDDVFMKRCAEACRRCADACRKVS